MTPSLSTTFSLDSRRTAYVESARSRHATTSTRALAYAENGRSSYRRAPLATQMFLPAIAGLVSSVLPAVSNLLPGLGNILGGLAGGGGGGGAAPAAGSGGASPELQQILQAVARLVSGNAGGAATTPAGQATEQSLRRRQLRALSQPGYARAQIAPAALLPMLQPLLQQVLTPETMRSLIESVSPARLTGTVINGLKDIANLGIQSHEQDLRHLRELNPGVEDAELTQLLAGMSIARHLGQGDLRYSRVRSVTLDFMDAPTHTIAGRQRVLYRHGRALELSLRLTTPRRIPRAGLQISIKDPTSLEVLARRRVRLERVESGPLERVRFEPGQLARLSPNQEYLVCATLVWRNKRRERRGTSKSQLITLVGGALVDRLGERTALVALTDNQRMAGFWHKAYASEFSRDRARVTLRCRYTYALDPDRDVNRRNPSRLRLEDEGRRRVAGRLATGMDLSLVALNALLPAAFDKRPLGEDELEALKDEDFVTRQHRAADTQVELYASPGNSGELWVYPEMGLHDLVLKTPDQVDEHGGVRSLSERVVAFPLPAAVFFASVSTDSSGRESEGPFAGKRVLDQRRVALSPVELAKREPAAEDAARSAESAHVG